MAISKVNPNSLSLSGELSSGNPLVTIDSTGTSSNEGHALKVIASGRGSGVNDVSILSVHNANGELLRVQNAGGISFNGDTAAANSLDDYEEGTWTPVVAQGWTSVTFPNSYQNGNYVKVGNLVTAWFYLQFSGTNASQHVRISGLPFNSPNEPAGAFRGGAVTYFNIPVNSTGMIVAYVAHNNNYIEFYSGDDAATGTTSNANASSDFLIGSVTYRAS